MKRKLLTIMVLLVGICTGAWANYTKTVDGSNVTLSWDFGEFGSDKSEYSSPYAYSGLSLVMKWVEGKDYIASKAFHPNGSTGSGNRYISYTPSFGGTITVTAKPNGGNDGERCVAIATEQNALGTSTKPSIGTDGVIAVTELLKSGGTCSTTLAAGTTYYIEVFQGVTINSVIFEYTDSRTNSSFELSSTSASIYVGKTTTIGYSGAAGSVSFSSSNTSVATVSDAGVVTAVAVGSATITVTDAGSAEVKDASLTFDVAVMEHTNTATVNNAASSGAIIVSNTQRQSDNKSAVYESIAKVYDFNGNTGVQAGSTQTFIVAGQTELTGLKLSANRRIAIQAADGVTITDVVCYVRCNADAATSLKQYYNSSGSAVTNEGGTDVSTLYPIVSSSTSTPTEINMTSYYQYGFVFSAQVQAVFKITYTKAKSMGVTIKETGHATLYTDYAVAIPDGVQAYWGKLNDDKDQLEMTEISGTIPAYTPVILKTETPGTYTFLTTEDETAISDNALKGTLTDKAVSANSVYTLGLNSDDEVGMRLYSGTSVRAYSAYIDASDISASRLMLIFGKDPTGIDVIGASQCQTNVRKVIKSGRLVIERDNGVFTIAGIQIK